MFGKIIFFGLFVVTLVNGEITYTAKDYREIIKKCSAGKDSDATQLCVMSTLGIMNENGQFDMKKFEHFLRAMSEDEPNRDVHIKAYMKCAEKAIGHTVATKIVTLNDCIDENARLLQLDSMKNFIN